MTHEIELENNDILIHRLGDAIETCNAAGYNLDLIIRTLLFARTIEIDRQENVSSHIPSNKDLSGKVFDAVTEASLLGSGTVSLHPEPYNLSEVCSCGSHPLAPLYHRPECEAGQLVKGQSRKEFEQWTIDRAEDLKALKCSPNKILDVAWMVWMDRDSKEAGK